MQVSSFFGYRVGDHLEVINKYNISQFRVGRVSKIVGKRLYIRYVDDDVEDGNIIFLIFTFSF